MPNMDEETKPKRWPFIIQLPSLCVAPIALLGRSLPSAEMKALGALCYVLVFFFAFPAGVMALRYIRKHAGALGSLEIPTKTLAIINIIMGVLVVAPLLFLFLAVVIFGVHA